MSQLADLSDIIAAIDFNSQETLMRLNFEKLKEIFRETIKEIKNPRYKGVILHYDNLDNIEESTAIEKLFGEIRDILLTSSVCFFFVGNNFLPLEIGNNTRIRQIFYGSPIEIKKLNFKEVYAILKKRVTCLKMNNDMDAICPHTEGVLKTLFELHEGNMRDTLKSLSTCVMEFSSSNIPIIIDDIKVRNILLNKIEKDYLKKLTNVEQQLLEKMLMYNKPITPSGLADISDQNVQNISSKYLPKLREKFAIFFVGKEGRSVYYQVAPEIRWLSLREHKNKINDNDIITEKETQRKLFNFLTN
jgi:hypothetical protein